MNDVQWRMTFNVIDVGLKFLNIGQRSWSAVQYFIFRRSINCFDWELIGQNWIWGNSVEMARLLKISSIFVLLISLALTIPSEAGKSKPSRSGAVKASKKQPTQSTKQPPPSSSSCCPNPWHVILPDQCGCYNLQLQQAACKHFGKPVIVDQIIVIIENNQVADNQRLVITAVIQLCDVCKVYQFQCYIDCSGQLEITSTLCLS